MPICEVDFKEGGSFRYLWRHEDGKEMGMHGIYREIAGPERLVHTECFDFGCDAQSAEQVVTTRLVEHNGKTTLTATILYPSKKDRDAIIASGMERGVAASYDRLEEQLAVEATASRT